VVGLILIIFVILAVETVLPFSAFEFFWYEKAQHGLFERCHVKLACEGVLKELCFRDIVGITENGRRMQISSKSSTVCLGGRKLATRHAFEEGIRDRKC
jgi:hypothetical protein